MPSVGKKKSCVSGQQNKTANDIVSIKNQLANGVLKTANQSQSGTFNDSKSFRLEN